MFHHLAQLLSQICQFLVSLSRARQRVKQPKSKSTQPSYLTRCPTLYYMVYITRADSRDLKFNSNFTYLRWTTNTESEDTELG